MGIIKKSAGQLIAFTIIATCFSCGTKQQQRFFETDIPKSTEKTWGQKKIYQIQPKDLLQIRNLQNRKYLVQEQSPVSANETSVYEVAPDSTITLPLIGNIKVAGLSRHEAAVHIGKYYSQELKDPIIELKIINLKVTLLGEVKNQGNYNLVKDETTLVELIGAAGGLTEKGNEKNIKIVRRNADTRQVLAINLSDIRTLSNPEILMQNNDIVYIAKHKKAVRTEKLQGLSAILQPVITFLNTIWMVHTLTRR